MIHLQAPVLENRTGADLVKPKSETLKEISEARTKQGEVVLKWDLWYVDNCKWDLKYVLEKNANGTCSTEITLYAGAS